MTAILAILSFTLGSVVPPHFTRSLVYECPRSRQETYMKSSPFWGASLDRSVLDLVPNRHARAQGWRSVQPDDKAVRVDESGNLISVTGRDGLYVEWQEPVARKALLFSYANRFIVNGREQTGHIHLDGIRHLVPVSLKKGTNSYLAAGAALFQLLPVDTEVSLLPDTAAIPDAGPGELGPFIGSIVATNTISTPRRVRIKAQVDGGSITITDSDWIPAMDSRIVRFEFSISRLIKLGKHALKLWGDKVSPCELGFSKSERGVARRCTYVSRFDSMVRGYAVQESLTQAAGQPIVLFTYGGGRSSLSNLSFIRAKSWCHVVSPEFRTSNWDGLGRRDALETLEVATNRLRADRTRSYLLGHSMGGHGAYQMAALNPQAFAGIALSAGWLSDFTYMPEEYPEIVSGDPIAKMFRLAMSEVDLESRLDPIASVKNVWIVHGDKDLSVPIKESYRILNELERRGTRVGFFIKKGAEHFWVDHLANQYDFPPIFEALRRSSRRGTGKLWDEIKVPPFWAQCMGRRSVAVYGTHGSSTENSESRDRARRESAIARERFGVDCEVVSDSVTLDHIDGRNVILFGTPDSNGLWNLHPTADALIRRARKRGARFTSWMIQANRGDQVWSAVGGADAAGCRLAYLFDPTDSYRRFPQWLLFNRSVTEKGIHGIAAAGFAGGPEAWRK